MVSSKAKTAVQYLAELSAERKAAIGQVIGKVSVDKMIEIYEQACNKRN